MFKLESAKPELFEFTYKGKKYGVPTVDSLPISTFMRIRKKMGEAEDASEVMFDEVMALFEQYAPKVMDEISLTQAKKLLDAYSASGSSNLGE